MSDDKRPRSLRDFDYFDEAVEPLMGDDPGGTAIGLEGQIEAYRKRQRRYSRYILLTTVTFVVCVGFLWSYRDPMAYAFGGARAAQELGDVTEMTPRDIPHNSYVTLSGITEHRGMTQKKVRGLGITRDELWYFRLLGSGGVFIEVLPDKEKYGYTTRVTVAGRAVDPAREGSYGPLLSDYHQLFASQRWPDLRVIEVGVAPGEGRGPYIVAILLVLALAVSNLVVLVRLVRARRLQQRSSSALGTGMD